MNKQIILDGREMTSKEKLHHYLKEQLDLPEYYGNNLDALKDCLTADFSPRIIEIHFVEDIHENLHRYGASLLNVFQDAAAENGSLKVTIKTNRK